MTASVGVHFSLGIGVDADSTDDVNLSKCNELDDLVASESVSQDVDNLLAERAILEDDLKHFFETYKVSVPLTPFL